MSLVTKSWNIASKVFWGISLLYCSQWTWAEVPSKKYQIEIPAQDLSSALLELGIDLGFSIIIPQHVALEGQTNELKGNFSIQDALKKLLENSGATSRQVGPNIFLIQPLNSKKYSADVMEELSVLGYQTGSHIFRSSYHAEGPIDQITALELERTGTQTLSDLIKFIPAVAGNSTSTAISNGGDGTTKVTLRGLPANNTLVLINGQRTTFDGLAGDSVDLNSISPAIIQQIDIYKDGASAIYGSEAIAGVVNVMTLTRYDGFKFSQYAGQTADGRSLTLSTDALWGIESEANSALLSISYYSQEGLFSRDRRLSRNADAREFGGLDQRSSATPNSRITFNDQSSVILKEEVNSEYPDLNDYREVTAEDLYNINEQNSTISPFTRISSYAFFSSELNQNITWHNQFISSKTDSTITLASTPLFTAFIDTPITVSKDNQFNPFGVDLNDVRRRMVELEPRKKRNLSDSVHVNSGLAIHRELSTWKANIFWNQVNADERYSNLIDGNKAARALGPASDCRGLEIDGCEPLNLFGAPGSITEKQIGYLLTENWSRGKSELRGINIDFSGNFVDMQEIAVGYAGGVEVRQEKSRLEVLNASNNAIGGVYHSPTQGKRTVYEVYGELLFPFGIHKPWGDSVDVELATRLANSSDFGETASPKLGLRYKLNSQISFRTTYSRGYRAPSIKELYKSGSKTFASLSDPCASENATSIYSGCSMQSDSSLNQFLTEYKGDINLSPEISKSFTFGITLTPAMFPDFYFAADIFDIRLRNIIDSNPQTLLNENAENGLFSDLITRDSNGNIVLIEAPFLNIGRRHVQGIDLSFRYSFKSLYWSINASHLRKFEEQLNQFTQVQDLAGTFRDAAENGNGSLPKWKANTGLTWMHKNLEINYTINYISSVTERVQANTGTFERKIDSWTAQNLQVQNQYFTYNLTLGVDNLFDKAPPFAASAFNDNYDAHAYDIKGRFIYLKIGRDF